jgi:flagellar assembly protein FliH
MEEAKARAASLERAAWDRGFEAGKAEGIETVRSEYSSLLDLIGRMADEIRSRADRLVAESEREIVRLATAVAEKIVRHVIETDPDATLEIVQEAIRRAQGARSLVVRVNPEDLEMLVMRRAELMDLVIDAKNLKIVEDARIGRGGCVVEMDTGAVDARIDEQFAEIGRAFAEELSHNG